MPRRRTLSPSDIPFTKCLVTQENNEQKARGERGKSTEVRLGSLTPEVQSLERQRHITRELVSTRTCGISLHFIKTPRICMAYEHWRSTGFYLIMSQIRGYIWIWWKRWYCKTFICRPC